MEAIGGTYSAAITGNPLILYHIASRRVQCIVGTILCSVLHHI